MKIDSDSHRIPWALAALVPLTLWAVVMWVFSRPAEIAWGFNGWRQAETQTMALFQSLPGARVWMPQIAWGGAGPSYVEAEMQLYTGVLGLMFRIFGPVEWPGQLFSLLCVASAIYLLSWEASRRFGLLAGVVSLCVGLSGRSAILIGTAVQPDSLAFLFVAISFVAFLRYVDGKSSLVLVVSLGATLAAALTKPPALHIGITQFMYVVLLKPQLLRRKSLWCGWLVVVALSSGYLLHAYSLATEFGNSFGVLSGDRKFPTWRSLVAVKLHLRTLAVVAKMGLTYPGTLAFLYLAYRKRLMPVHWASLAGYAAFVLVAQRYTSDPDYSAHYHIHGLIPGMMLVATAVVELRTEPFWQRRKGVVWMSIGTATFVILSLVDGLNYRKAMADTTLAATQFIESVRKYVKPHDLIVVRSAQESVCEPFWGGGPNNYQDPRYFYLTGTTGWVLPSDDLLTEELSRASNEGAQFYVEPLRRAVSTKLQSWLGKNAQLVVDDEFGRLYQLDGPTNRK